MSWLLRLRPWRVRRLSCVLRPLLLWLRRVRLPVLRLGGDVRPGLILRLGAILRLRSRLILRLRPILRLDRRLIRGLSGSLNCRLRRTVVEEAIHDRRRHRRCRLRARRGGVAQPGCLFSSRSRLRTIVAAADEFFEESREAIAALLFRSLGDCAWMRRGGL